MRMRSRLAIVLFASATAGCRHKLPDGVSRAHFDELVQIADEAARHCDELLSRDDCYTQSDENADPSKGVPLPAQPLGGAIELRSLTATCELLGDHPGHHGWCDSRLIDKGPHSPEPCTEGSFYESWGELSREKDGETVVVGPKTCSLPWITINIIRLSPKRARLDLHANFLPRGWLQAHGIVRSGAAPPR
jgi:hypothetical protein